MIQIGYLGPEGTFSQQAALSWLSRNAGIGELIAYASIPETLWALKAAKIAYAVVPSENSIEGAVNLTWDILAGEDLQILAEIVLPIEHHLVGLCCLEEAKVVYSHPQALAQCRGFLEEKLKGREIQQAASTAEAALRASREDSALAISSAEAAEIYGLKLLVSGIQDIKDNKTRFVVVGRDTFQPSGLDKTSLVLALPRNRPGGLFEVLREFAEEGINLTRIESRPTKADLGEYLFFIDCDGHGQLEPLKGVLKKLKKRTVLLKVLGSYPVDKEAGSGEGN